MYRGLRGSMGTLDNANPTRLSKRHQMSPYRNSSITPSPLFLSVALELNSYFKWLSFLFSKCSTLLFKKPSNLSLNGNLSPNGLGHLLTLEVNSSLHVIRVSFQLYGQLKKSPHDGMGVLDSSAILMASQTTRLGKGSSVMTRDEHVS